MNSVVINTEQKKKEFELFKATVQKLLAKEIKGGTYRVSSEMVDFIEDHLLQIGEGDAFLAGSTRNGNKENSYVLIGFGEDMLMLKRNVTDYTYTVISRDSFPLDMPTGDITLDDIYIPRAEYKLEEFFKDTNKAAVPGVLSIAFSQALRPLVVCNDGFSLSIQASNGHYCAPCENNRTDYSNVEIGNISAETPELEDYVELGSKDDELCKRVYAFVPKDVVETVLKKHGGIDKEKTITESYLAKLSRTEQGLNSANSKMDDLQNLSNLVERLTGIKNIFGR